MTRTCRICGGDDGRYWIETPVEKYAEKTFGQLLVELTRIEVGQLSFCHPIAARIDIN